MLLNQALSDRQEAYPIILGAGLTGLAVSRALSAAGITHVLVGDRPAETPRLGESLNAEGSLEILRGFPEFARFFHRKQRLALFFGGHALAYDSLQFAAGHAYYPLLGFPSTVQLLHLDRVGFDRALFEAVIADDHCLFAEGGATELDYDPATDRINGVLLGRGETVVSRYVFDATNHVRFVARKLGVRCNVIGEPRRVVFAHSRPAEGQPASPSRWVEATSLLRLDALTDPVEGLAWCIPLVDYVSVGVSVDPTKTGAGSTVLLDWVEDAYSKRGLNVRAAFSNRGAAVDLRHEHYNHERCYGRNWLLTGPTCCQFWFPSATGVATGLVAARLAPDVLGAPREVPAMYQAYIDRTAASHSGLDWLVRDDPWSVTLEDLRQRSEAMIVGNVQRFGGYLDLEKRSSELAFGNALLRMFEEDRLKANPFRIDTAAPEAQETRLFAQSGGPDPWTDAPIEVAVLSRPDKLDGPKAILGLVDVLSGRRGVATSAELVTENLKLQIDQFHLQGIGPWNAWATFLVKSPRVTRLELVAGALAGSNTQWVLTGQWHGLKAGLETVSPQFSMTFGMTNERVAAIQTQRADHTFVVGDFILPQAAFAAMLGRMLSGTAT
jgi:flavin-dependent dehydrogenase